MGDEAFEVRRRDIAHADQRLQHQEMRIERAGIVRRLRQRARQLLLQAQPRPGAAEVAQGLELGGGRHDAPDRRGIADTAGDAALAPNMLKQLGKHPTRLLRPPRPRLGVAGDAV